MFCVCGHERLQTVDDVRGQSSPRGQLLGSRSRLMSTPSFRPMSRSPLLLPPCVRPARPLSLPICLFFFRIRQGGQLQGKSFLSFVFPPANDEFHYEPLTGADADIPQQTDGHTLDGPTALSFILSWI